MKYIVRSVFVLLVLVFGPGVVSAGGVPLAAINPDLQCPDGQLIDCTWFAGAPAAPIPVQWDPSAGSFTKSFSDPGQVNPGDTVKIWEFFTVSGTPWTDWHEDIVTSNWAWNTAVGTPTIDTYTTNGLGQITGRTPVPGLIVMFNPLVDPASLAFDFQAITTGTNVLIEKYITWNGGTTGPHAFEIAEFPTVPVPAALPLLLSGLLGWGLVGWRKRFK